MLQCPKCLDLALEHLSVSTIFIDFSHVQALNCDRLICVFIGAFVDDRAIAFTDSIVCIVGEVFDFFHVCIALR